MQQGPVTPETRHPLELLRSRAATATTWAFAFSFAVNLLLLSLPIYMLQVFDRVLSSGSASTLLFLTLIVLGALLTLGLVDAVRSRMLVRIGLWIERSLAPETFARIIRAAVADGTYTSEALRDLALLRSFISGPAATTLLDAPWTPVFLLVMFLLHPALGTVSLIAALGLLALAWTNERATHEPFARSGRDSAAMNRFAAETVRNAETVDAMGMQAAALSRWLRGLDEVSASQSVAAERAAMITATSKVARFVAQVAILGTGAYLVITGGLTPGGMIAGSVLMSRALAPVDQAIGAWRQGVAAFEAHRRVSKLMDPANSLPRRSALPRPESRLTAEDIIFARPGINEMVLKAVSLEANPGEAIAIVGPSAAGKSTLAKILTGTLKPRSGEARLGGADISAFSGPEKAEFIGYLPQEVSLFSGTVAENIARLRQTSLEPVIEAAKAAGAHDLILRLPKGYDTEVGELGSHLSGGQRQRIALARAVFDKPALVVLDEPTANLDGTGEEALHEAIAALKREGAAVVVFGHRPSLLREIDRVYVLRDGRIELEGPTADVVAKLQGTERMGTAGSNIRSFPNPGGAS